MKFLLAFLLVSSSLAKICIVGIHGLLGSCTDLDKELKSVAKDLSGENSEIEGICINEKSGLKTMTNEMEAQTDAAYNKLKEQGCNDVYIIAVSQGAAIANHIISHHKSEDSFKIKGLATFGRVNRGIHSLHGGCKNFFLQNSKLGCCLGNSAKGIKREDKGEEFKSTATFVRNATNDTQTFKEASKKNFLDLEKIILVGYKDENMIKPHETAYFLWADKDKHRLPFNDDQFFNEDRLGLLEQFARGNLGIFEYGSEHAVLSDKMIDLVLRVMLAKGKFKTDSTKNAKTIEEVFNAFTAQVDSLKQFNGIMSELAEKTQKTFSTELVNKFETLDQKQGITFVAPKNAAEPSNNGNIMNNNYLKSQNEELNSSKINKRSSKGMLDNEISQSDESSHQHSDLSSNSVHNSESSRRMTVGTNSIGENMKDQLKTNIPIHTIGKQRQTEKHDSSQTSKDKTENNEKSHLKDIDLSTSRILNPKEKMINHQTESNHSSGKLSKQNSKKEEKSPKSTKKLK